VLRQQRTLREPHTNLTGLSVLLVEDNLLNQQLARTFLERAGMHVTLAENGAEALARLAPDDAAFDIVLMDIQMPVMDGFTATRHIRADARHASLPIIATTAHAMAEDREQCIAAGMQDYLTKPIDVSQMYARISQWTGRTATMATADTQTTPQPPVSHALADRTMAIARIGGHVDIYREVIATFLTDQTNTAEKLRGLLAASDIVTAHRIAHTLKGTAATIGATNLYDAALALDSDLKAGTLPDDWPARMDAVESQLAATLLAIQAELSSSSS
jgi:CheY-like chemotaxis protein